MKNSISFLIIIIILAGVINTVGIEWGLPNQNHLLSYNLDEYSYIDIIGKNINPSKFDFDPNLYYKTHIPIYYTGIIIKIGESIGLYEIGTKEYYKKNIEEFRNVVLLQRVLWGKVPIIFLILVSFLIGRSIIDDKFGFFFAAVAGFLPTILTNSNFSLEPIILVVFTAFCCYFSLKFHQSERLQDLILAGVFAGLAISTRQDGPLSIIFLLSTLISKRKESGTGTTIRYFLISGIACAIAFSLTSPYYVKFLLFKIFAPSRIQPDVFGKTNLPSNILNFNLNLNYIFSGVLDILRINSIQLGKILFLFIPIGIYFERKNIKFKIILSFLIISLLSYCFVKVYGDRRYILLPYFLAILGTAGIYHLIKLSKSNVSKGLIASLLVISLSVYAGVIKFHHLKEDNRQISSQFIIKYILNVNDNITIGLNRDANYTFPDIINKEWMHNKHPNDSFYISNYNETFIIPDHTLNKLGGDQILPEKELSLRTEKMKWLESKSPDYVILSDKPQAWHSYFNKSKKYELLKHFPKYSVLGVQYLSTYSFDIYIYKKI